MLHPAAPLPQQLYQSLLDQVQDSERDAQARAQLGWARPAVKAVGRRFRCRLDTVGANPPFPAAYPTRPPAAARPSLRQGRPPKHCLVSAATRREMSGWGEKRITVAKAKARGAGAGS